MILNKALKTSFKEAEKKGVLHLIEQSKTLFKKDEDKLEVLKELLGYAVTLEFATIPIYLSAMWTIKDNNCTVAKSIRNIFQEEMLHLSMVCNMLVGIGGEPQLYKNKKKRLAYPTGLPGGVHPELFLHLEGFNNCSLRNFMEIELPDEVADIYDYKSGKKIELTKLCGDGEDLHKADKNHDHTHNSTIGALYTRINELFQEIQPAMNTERQLAGPLAWFVMADATSVSKAIDFIKEQGEGSENVTPASTGMDDLAHFYRFWEVYYEKKIVEENGKYYFKDPLPRPDSYKIARIPKEGYLKDDVTSEVWYLLNEFDKTYSELVMLLEDAWAADGAGQASLIKGIEVMFKLEKYALPLIKTPIPGHKEGLNYGACFRIVDLD